MTSSQTTRFPYYVDDEIVMPSAVPVLWQSSDEQLAVQHER